MNEIKIELSEVDPQDFFGQHNIHIEKLRDYFPKLKIVARGSNIKAFGEQPMLDEFEKRIEMLITHFEKFNNLNEDVIERVVSSNGVASYILHLFCTFHLEFLAKSSPGISFTISKYFLKLSGTNISVTRHTCSLGINFLILIAQAVASLR